MKFISCDGEQYETQSKALLHTGKLKIDALLHGKLSEFDKNMMRELGQDQISSEHFHDAQIDWLGGYVRMYNKRGMEIAAVKIDTDYYRFPDSEK